jgi:hypothetical protein
MNDSVQLHRRVALFGQAALGEACSDDTFAGLALEIARYQVRKGAVVGRAHAGTQVLTLADVLPVPADVFRMARVAVHPPEQDVVRFETSGTTGGAGVHAFRSLDTYRTLSVAWGRRALLGPHAGKRLGVATVVALAAPFEPARVSSLGFMMQQFMADIDGRALSTEGPFEPNEAGRWLVGPSGVDSSGLRRAAQIAEARAEPLLLLATAFALAWLVKELGSERIALPVGSTVMITGGFKGHHSALDPQQLSLRVCEKLDLPPTRLVGEYGMTELGSQLYDAGFTPGQSSVYVEPPWLRVTPLDPKSLFPVATGEVGLACFTDLANVDSALRVVTHDLVRREPSGVVLLGRRQGARLRGCSLSVEATSHGRSQGAERSASSTAPRASRSPDELAQAEARVIRLLGAARELHRPGAARRRLCAELAQTTGLSPAGVAWGLDRCLEVEPTEREVSRLVALAATAPRAHVILPGHVFVAALRAIALALAACSRVYVKPSRRQPTLASALLEQAPGLFELVHHVEAQPADHVWLYGSDETASSLSGALPPGVVLHAHRSGFGVAAVAGVDRSGKRVAREALAWVARAVSEDAALFEQRGCLSPRFVLVEGDQPLALELGEQIAQAFAELEGRIPRGRMDEAEQADQIWYERSMGATGHLLRAGQGAVGVRLSVDDQSAGPSASDLPPVGRVLEVIAVDNLECALVPLTPWLTTVGCGDSELATRLAPQLPRARVCLVSQMQQPPFDGPVDRRTSPAGIVL